MRAHTVSYAYTPTHMRVHSEKQEGKWERRRDAESTWTVFSSSAKTSRAGARLILSVSRTVIKHCIVWMLSSNAFRACKYHTTNMFDNLFCLVTYFSAYIIYALFYVDDLNSFESEKEVKIVVSQ